MSVLLRRPATVPTLFSRSVDADLPAARPAAGWRRRAGSGALIAVSGWAALLLIGVPLVKAAAAVLGLALPR